MRSLSLLLAIAMTIVPAEEAAADLYVDLVKGSPQAQSDAALQIIKDPKQHAGTTVRRALYVSTRMPNAHLLPHIANIVKDDSVDVSTRTAAAMALGTIGKEHPDLWPPGNGDPPVHRPLPVFARKALSDCVSDGNPVMLRRACAEALGTAGVQGAAAILQPIASNPGEDPSVRLFAGRGLTLLTGVPSVAGEIIQAFVVYVNLVVQQ